MACQSSFLCECFIARFARKLLDLSMSAADVSTQSISSSECFITHITYESHVNGRNFSKRSQVLMYDTNMYLQTTPLSECFITQITWKRSQVVMYEANMFLQITSSSECFIT
eukprot:366774_1